MLGMFKKNIITQLMKEQLELLPLELWENIEDATISQKCVLYDTKFIDVIVQIIDYYNGSVLDEIIIKDFNKDLVFNEIKLSSDSKCLIYIDTSCNIIFYDIFLKQITYSKNLGFININIYDVKYYYFDNNGCRFSISYGDTTDVYNIQTSEKILTIDYLTTDHKFNKDYTLFICYSSDIYRMDLYDMDRKKQVLIFYDNFRSYNISNSGKYVIADESDSDCKNFILWNIETNKIIIEFENSDSDDVVAVSSFAFSKDEKYVAIHYYDGTLIICDINSGQIINKVVDNDFLFPDMIKMELI
jgi:WD40 repeat protein